MIPYRPVALYFDLLLYEFLEALLSKLIFPLNYFTPRDYQIPIFSALDRGIKRILMVWARQMGKDTTTFVGLVGKALKDPGNYFYIFPTREAAKKAVWEKIDRDGKALLSCIPESKLLKKSDQEMLLKLRSGLDGLSEATIRFVGLDYNPDSIRGITPRGVIFSEFAYQDPDVYKVILPALSQHPDAWAIYQSTPNGKNHYYDLFNRVQKAPGWFVSYKQVLYPDAPGYVANVITLEDIKRTQAESGMTDEFVAQEYGCSWDIGAQGSVYSANILEAEKDHRIGLYGHDRNLIVDTFWDLGITDPTAIWFRQRKGNREIFIDYLEVNNCDFQEIVAMLVDLPYRYGSHYLPHDGNQIVQQTKLTDSQLIQVLLKEFNCKGHVYTCPKVPKYNQINGVRARFPNFCFDAEKCKPGLKALDAYRYEYDSKRKVYSKEPRHDWASHAADALGCVIGSEELDDRIALGYVKKLSRSYDFDPLDY